MPASVLDIFIKVLLPVLATASLGALLQWRLKLNLQTLVRLNLYLFIPVFLFDRTARSTLTWPQIAGLLVAVLLPMAIVGGGAYAILRLTRARPDTRASVLIGSIFYNAANFGIPVSFLAFGPAGEQVQVLIVMIVNSAFFFLGYAIIALAQGKGARGALGYFRLPMVYALVAGFAVRETGWQLPVWADSAVVTVAAGMVPVALVTLGAQMVTRARLPRLNVVGPVVLMKLAVLPVVTGAVAWALGLWPWPGAQLVLAASAPTAVNTLLLALELEADAETAADCVFWTSILSAITVTVAIALILALGGGPPGMTGG